MEIAVLAVIPANQALVVFAGRMETLVIQDTLVYLVTLQVPVIVVIAVLAV